MAPAEHAETSVTYGFLTWERQLPVSRLVTNLRSNTCQRIRATDAPGRAT